MGVAKGDNRSLDYSSNKDSLEILLATKMPGQAFKAEPRPQCTFLYI